MPDWFWWGQDGCWFCKQRNNCNQCKANREYAKEFGEKKQKGRHASAKRGARTKPQLMEDASLEQMVADYGFRGALQIMAECIFEQLGFDDMEFNAEQKSEGAAIKFIHEWMEG